MAESNGAMMRNVSQALPGVDYVQVEVSDCNLNLGRGIEPGARIIADYCRSWQSMEAEKAVSAVHVGNSSGQTSTACLFIHEGTVFEDVSVTVKGKSVLDGSVSADSVSLAFHDGSIADLDSVKAESVLINAFDASSVTIKNIEATRIIVFVDHESSVTVQSVKGDLVMVRHSGAAKAVFRNAEPLNEELAQTGFGLSGDADRMVIPTVAYMLEQDIVDDYWGTLLAGTD